MEQQNQRIEWDAEFPVGAPMAIVHNALRLTSFGRANLEAAMWAFNAIAKNSLNWQRHAAEYTSQRLDKNTEFARNLMNAKDTSEVLRIQAEYLRDAANDWVQGTQQLMESTTQVSQEIMKPLKERAEEAADEVEKRAEQRGGRQDFRMEVAAS